MGLWTLHGVYRARLTLSPCVGRAQPGAGARLQLSPGGLPPGSRFGSRPTAVRPRDRIRDLRSFSQSAAASWHRSRDSTLDARSRAGLAARSAPASPRSAKPSRCCSATLRSCPLSRCCFRPLPALPFFSHSLSLALSLPHFIPFLFPLPPSPLSLPADSDPFCCLHGTCPGSPPPGFVRCDPSVRVEARTLISSTYIWPMDFDKSKLVDDSVWRSKLGLVLTIKQQLADMLVRLCAGLRLAPQSRVDVLYAVTRLQEGQ